MAQASITGWKKWLAFGFGFGAGSALAAGIILGAVAWHSSHTPPWNDRNITATFSRPLYHTDDKFNITGIDLEYVIENNTAGDFTLSPEQTLFYRDGEALTVGEYRVAGQCFVPAKNKVKCEIAAPADFNTTYLVEGFALFDNSSRYNIVFPKPSGPTPDDRRKFVSDFQKGLYKTGQ